MKTTMVFLASLLTLTFSGFSQTVYDQSFRDASFVKFKTQLMQAVVDRDTAKLFPLLAAQVHVNEDRCSYAAKECFMNQFRQGGPDAEKLWDDMMQIVSFGFSRNVIKNDIYRLASEGDLIFQAPSYLNGFDDKNKTYLFVLGQGVNVREQPNVKSKVIAQASFETLRYIDPLVTGLRSDFHFYNGKQWFEVVLADGKTGYIIEDYVSANINRELSVKKVNGEWRIISFFSPLPKC